MESFTLDELKLAFAYQLVVRIVDSDGVMVPEESRFIERTFPPAALEKAGFVKNGGFTPRFQEALGEALMALPDLDVSERLDLMETLWRAATVDGVFQGAEVEAVSHAGQLLGLTAAQVRSRIDPKG